MPLYQESQLFKRPVSHGSSRQGKESPLLLIQPEGSAKALRSAKCASEHAGCEIPTCLAWTRSAPGDTSFTSMASRTRSLFRKVADAGDRAGKSSAFYLFGPAQCQDGKESVRYFTDAFQIGACLGIHRPRSGFGYRTSETASAAASVLFRGRSIAHSGSRTGALSDVLLAHTRNGNAGG